MSLLLGAVVRSIGNITHDFPFNWIVFAFVSYNLRANHSPIVLKIRTRNFSLAASEIFFLPWFCRFITSHPVSQPSVSYSALNFDLIRSIHRQLGTMVLGKVRLLLSCGKISLAVVEQAWKNITKHKQLVNKLRLTFHDQVKILRQNF